MPRMLDRTPWLKMKKFLEHQAMEAGRKKIIRFVGHGVIYPERRHSPNAVICNQEGEYASTE